MTVWRSREDEHGDSFYADVRLESGQRVRVEFFLDFGDDDLRVWVSASIYRKQKHRWDVDEYGRNLSTGMGMSGALAIADIVREFSDVGADLISDGFITEERPIFLCVEGSDSRTVST